MTPSDAAAARAGRIRRLRRCLAQRRRTPTLVTPVPCILLACLVLALLGCGRDDRPQLEAPEPTVEPSSPRRDAPASRPADCEAQEDEGNAALARRLLELVNEARASGASCGPFGPQPPARALEPSPALSCAAHLQSRDMGERGFFSHVNPDGLDTGERARRSGFAGRAAENLAWGQSQPADVVESWLRSPGHCKTMLDGRWTLTGVAYHCTQAGRDLWAQLFGSPL